MKNHYLILLFLIGCTLNAQSFRTVTLTGSAADFTDQESYNAPENNTITYGVAYDETNLYLSVVNTAGTFGQADSFNIFIDTDPDGDVLGSTTGTNFANVTPTLPFNANYAIRVEENYNERREWTGTDWSALTQNFTAQVGNNHRQFVIAKTDLGNPEMIRFTMWMGYNGGTFAEVPADRNPNNDNNPVFTEYFGSVDINRAGSNPSKVVNTNATYASYGSSTTIPAGTYSILEVDGFPTVAGDITIAPGGTLAWTGITILNLGANNLTFDNWAGMAVDASVPATLNGTGIISFTNGGLSQSNNSTSNVSLTINPEIVVDGQFYANGPVVRNAITFNANAFNHGPLRYSQGSVLTYRSNLMTTTGPEWGTGSIVALNGVPDNVIVDQPSLAFDTDKNLFGYLQIDSGNLDLNGFDLILKSDTSRSAVIGPIASGASVIGNTVVARRFIPRRADSSPAFRFLASPVNGQTIFESIQANGSTPLAAGTQVTGGAASDGFDQSSTNNPSMFGYNNVSQAWEAVANTNATNFEVGVPFRTFIRGDRSISLTQANQPANNTTLVATGSIVQGDVTYDAASMLNPLSDTANGFNMIANPYPSYTDMSLVLDQSTDVNANFYYMWDPSVNTRGSYVTVSLSTTNALINGTNNVMSSDADQFLEPWQACFIVNDASASNVSVLFSEDTKTVETTATQVFNTPATLNRLALTLYNDQDVVLDGTLVDYDATFSNAIDGMDALKISNLDENLGVQVVGNNYSVLRNAMPLDGEILDLSIGNYRSSNYKISMQRDGLVPYDITLVDTYLNVQHDISTSDYTFTVDASITASTATDRFHVIFNNVTLGGGDAAFAKAISIYPNPVGNDKLFINNTTGSTLNVTLYNMMGQLVLQQEFMNESFIDLSTINTGAYIIELSSGTEKVSQQVIIK